MDKTVQMEVVAFVGVASIAALVLGESNLAGIGLAGLLGFLGGQAITPQVDPNSLATLKPTKKE
ncbi:MAG: hypothetical protein K8E24_003130 [Methanobacterium paludis]|nr:hypothetical protein [Methanobacterium paludis]